MDAGDKIALGAMIVAIVAALVAVWQASEARGARKVAREQADIAKDALAQTTKQSAAAERSATAADLSASAADRSAGAAEDQVVEARKAVRAAEAQVAEARRAAEAAERSARAEESAGELAARQAHDAAAPKFELKRSGGAVPRTEIKVTMIEGTPLSEVTIRPRGRNAELVEGFTTLRSGEPLVSALKLGPTRKGEMRDVVVHSKEVNESTPVAIELHCVPVEQGVEPWTVHETLTLVPPMRVLSARGPRIPRTAERGRNVFRDRRPPY